MTNPEINQCGDQYWYNKSGKLHREDGPAYISAPDTGVQHWYINGKLHREDGPAVIYADGYQEWWINYYSHTNNKSFQKAANLSNEQMATIVAKYGDVK